MLEDPRIFLSYARLDGKDFADELRSELESHGFSLFQDITHLEAGEDWWLQVDKALHTVEFVVLILTPAAVASRYVEKEWRLARQLGVCVVPVYGVPRDQLNLQCLRPWMRQEHAYNLEISEQKTRFIRQLESPCKVPRVPFMADDLPVDFVPRSREFNALKRALLDPRKDQPVAITAALRGAGGYGKTTLARAVCHDPDIQDEFHDGVLWVTLGENPRELTTKVADLIETISGARPGLQDTEAAASRLAEALAERDCLLVIDDVWDPAHAKPFLRGGKQCGRLITTRTADTLPSSCVQHDLDAMASAEAVELLAFELPADIAAQDRLPGLATRLGEWPLLLKLANGALREEVNAGETLGEALDYIEELLDERGLLAFDSDNPEDRNRAVAATLGLSTKRLDEDQRARLSQLAIFPEDVDIPLHLVQHLWHLSRVASRELCRRFFRASLLLDLDLEKHTIRLHDTIRELLRKEEGESLRQWNAGFLDAIRPESGNWWDLPQDQEFFYRHLPWHLSEAGRQDELRQLFLTFTWLDAKLRATDINTLLADFLCGPEDETLPLIEGALRLAAHVLVRHPEQLASQLFGRLMGLRDRPEIARLLRTVEDRRPVPSLWPTRPILAPPGGPLIRTLAGHSEGVSAVALTPDGRRAVSASNDQTLKLWDLDSGEEIRTLAGHSEGVSAVALTPDGRRAVSASWDQTLKVWDLDSGEEIRTLSGHADSVYAVALTPDGRKAVSASRDQTLKVWDLDSGEELRTLAGHKNGVNAVALTPDGRRAVSASYDRTLKVWNLDSGEEVGTLAGHSSWVNAVALTPDGRRAVSASDDKTLKVWDLDSGEEVGTLAGHKNGVYAVALTPDGRRAVSASSDQTLKVWDLDSGEELRTLAGHSFWVHAVALTPDGRRAVSASSDKTLKVWDLDSGEELRTLAGHSEGVHAVALTPDGRKAVSASRDQTLKVWDLDSGEELRTLAGHAGRVYAVALTPDGRRAVSASWDQTLKVWDLDSGEELRTLAGHSFWVHAVAVTTDGRRAVSASSDNTLKVWNLDSGEELRTLSGHADSVRTLSGHADSVNAVALTPDGRRAVSASDDKTLKVWDLDTGEELRTLSGHADSVNALAVTPDGRRAVSASSDNTLKVWDLDSGEELRTLAGHSGAIYAVAVTTDGHRAVSASFDNTLKVWDLDSGEELRTLSGHADWVNALALTPDGHRAVSASSDKTLKVWDLDTGKCLAAFSAEGAVHCCLIAPDAQVVVAGDSVGRLYFLKIVDREPTKLDHPVPLARA